MSYHPSSYSIHRRDALLAVLCLTQSLWMAPQVSALPSGSSVVAGSATVTQPTTNAMHIEQASQKAIINWQSFSAERGELVNIVQPESSSVLLNRVIGDNPSAFFGQLHSNGQVFLVNPNGIYFAPGSQLNTGGLVASTLSLSNRDFLAGNYAFTAQSSMGSVINNGNVHSGFVALLGNRVENHGAIVTTRGSVALGAGDAITLDLDASGLIALTVNQATYNAHLQNSGILEAEDGTVLLKANAVNDLLAGVVNNSGRVVATKIREDNGAIVIESGSLLQTGELVAPTIDVAVNRMIDGGVWRSEEGNITIKAATNVEQTATSQFTASGENGGTITLEAGKQLYLSGTIDANGQKGNGGTITVTAPTTTVAGATLRANGSADGGTVLIGGGWQGNNPNVTNAIKTTVTANSSIAANAGIDGDGGTVVIWSDEATRFAGTIAANGGSNNGNGGSVEVSGREELVMSGNVSTQAVNGKEGVLLLDPRNITIEQPVESTSFQFISLLDPYATAGNQHGSGGIIELQNGNLFVSSPLDDFAGSDAGALRLYRPDGTLLSTLTGSSTGDMVGSSLTTLQGNSNAVLNAPNWTNGSATKAGAITWINGTNGLSGVISESNSFIGSHTNDGVNAQVIALHNGNYVAHLPSWQNGEALNAGAVVWGNGTSGSQGVISETNSLVGAKVNDSESSTVVALSNGNYVVASPQWDNGATANVGAVTWGNGEAGTVGAIGSGNSLIGTKSGDNVGLHVTALTNGNYVVGSPNWDNGSLTNVGAATWANGSTPLIGTINATNSLIGSKSGDYVASAITALSNNNYVVVSPLWNSDSAADVGAVTLGNGTVGTTGLVNSTNSLVGTTASDGVNLSATALTNGNFVVVAPKWDNGGNADVGAIILGNGVTGNSGQISAGNSLIGTSANDIESAAITTLQNGNYVVTAPKWDNGTTVDAGAVTWGNGESGTIGTINSSNSLVGTVTNDLSSATVTPLKNGNYVVTAPKWDNGAIVDAGAVAWGNGTSGTVGIITESNSLVGSKKDDLSTATITPLTNGNYVVSASLWDNGSTANVGAVTWGNGESGTVGSINSSNSLIGIKSGDKVGALTVALSDGNYATASAEFDNGSLTNSGVVTIGNGFSGTVGVISSANSLLGSEKDGKIGSGGLTPLHGTNGSGGVAISSPLAQGGSGNVTLMVPSLSDSSTTLASDYTYAMDNSSDVTITPKQLSDLLNNGTSVRLQASNNIMLHSALTANGSQSTTLELDAGKSIFLNNSLSIGNSNLTLIANDSAAHGVENAQREAGAAVITMASGTSITTGNGNVTIELRNGGERSNNTSGDITLGSITAGTITVVNNGTSDASGIVLNGNHLTANQNNGSTIVLAGQQFTNSSNATLHTAPNARWLIYTSSPQATQKGGLTSSFRLYNRSLTTLAPSEINQQGNGFIYASSPDQLIVNLTLSDGSEKSIYGNEPNATLGYTLHGFSDSEENADTIGLNGTLQINGMPHATSPVGNYEVTYSGGLYSSNGFTFTTGNPLTLTVQPQPITINPDDQSKEYDTTDPNLTWQAEAQSNGRGLLPGDTFSGALGREAGENVGTYAITLNTLHNDNYAISFIPGTFTITQRPLTLSALPIQKMYGETDPILAVAITAGSLANTLQQDSLSDVIGTLSREAGDNVGNYNVVLGNGIRSANYNITFAHDNHAFTITPRPLTLSATPAQKVYGEADPALAVTITAGSLATASVQDALSDVTGVLSRQAGNNVGSYDMQLGSGSRAANYNITFTADNNAFTITPRPVVLAANNINKIYGDLDPALTWKSESADPTFAAENQALLRSLEQFNNSINGINNPLNAASFTVQPNSNDTASTSHDSNDDTEASSNTAQATSESDSSSNTANGVASGENATTNSQPQASIKHLQRSTFLTRIATTVQQIHYRASQWLQSKNYSAKV